MRVVRHWTRFHREVVNTSSLEMLKVRLDRALSSLIYCSNSLPMAGGLDCMIFKVSFQHKPFHDSVSLSL